MTSTLDHRCLIDAAVAAASAGTTEAQALITGEESHATKFERGVQTLLADGGWEGTTWRVDAAFGVFGSLPLVGVTFGDAFVLVDSVNGNLDGPFALDTAIDARTLLASHASYVPSSSVRLFTTSGCSQPMAAPRWRPTLPTWGTPPWGLPSWTLFGPNYFCTLILPATLWPRVDCNCVREGTSTDGSGRAVRTRERCTCTSCASTGTGLGPPSGWVPPGGTPTTPAGSTSCTCVTEYFH